jgi:ATP-dependent phosphoenolpyruvate carboxykinase
LVRNKQSLNEGLSGKLNDVKYTKDLIFGFQVPMECPGVPPEVLSPSSSWDDKKEYARRYKDLAMRFKENFAKFANQSAPDIVTATFLDGATDSAEPARGTSCWIPGSKSQEMSRHHRTA